MEVLSSAPGIIQMNAATTTSTITSQKNDSGNDLKDNLW